MRPDSNEERSYLLKIRYFESHYFVHYCTTKADPDPTVFHKMNMLT